MKTLSDLKEGDYIAFGFDYHGGKPTEVLVTNITSKHNDRFIVHFLYGHHSLSEALKQEDILAIKTIEGKTKIRGYNANFEVINNIPDNLKSDFFVDNI